MKLNLSQGPAIHIWISSGSADEIEWEQALYWSAGAQKQTVWVKSPTVDKTGPGVGLLLTLTYR